MVRLLNISCIFLVALTVLALYQVSEKTRVTQMALNRAEYGIVQQRRAIAVLEAEWQHVAAPGRVQRFAGALGMNDAASVQLSAFEQLPRRGEEAARRCTKLLAAADEDVVLRKWSLPVLTALAEPSRFSELRAELPGITPRALALALKDLQAADLIERRVEDAYPPRAVYSATRQGRRLQQIVA